MEILLDIPHITIIFNPNYTMKQNIFHHPHLLVCLS